MKAFTSSEQVTTILCVVHFMTCGNPVMLTNPTEQFRTAYYGKLVVKLYGNINLFVFTYIVFIRLWV